MAVKKSPFLHICYEVVTDIKNANAFWLWAYMLLPATEKILTKNLKDLILNEKDFNEALKYLIDFGLVKHTENKDGMNELFVCHGRDAKYFKN